MKPSCRTHGHKHVRMVDNLSPLDNAFPSAWVADGWICEKHLAEAVDLSRNTPKEIFEDFKHASALPQT